MKFGKATCALSLGIEKVCPKTKLSQEEMMGFVLIVILVAVILVIFVGFSLRTEQVENVESYEVESFIQSMLQHTTECRDNFEHLNLNKLIFACIESESCIGGEDSCKVLSENLNGITREAWKIENRPLGGYELIILLGEEEIERLEAGNKTNNYKGAIQEFSRSGESISVLFRAYY